MNIYGEWNTIAEAERAVNECAMDVEADHGKAGVEEGWGDIVRVVAENCVPVVRKELFRRHGILDLED